MDSDWPPKTIAQLVGWGLLFLGVALLLETNLGRAALGCAGVGLLVLFASLFLRGADT